MNLHETCSSRRRCPSPSPPLCFLLWQILNERGQFEHTLGLRLWCIWSPWHRPSAHPWLSPPRNLDAFFDCQCFVLRTLVGRAPRWIAPKVSYNWNWRIGIEQPCHQIEAWIGIQELVGCMFSLFSVCWPTPIDWYFLGISLPHHGFATSSLNWCTLLWYWLGFGRLICDIDRILLCCKTGSPMFVEGLDHRGKED